MTRILRLDRPVSVIFQCLALFFILTVSAAHAGTTVSQSSDSASVTQQEQNPTAKQSEDGAVSADREAAKESRQASEDDTAEIKHSASVVLLARVTGLSVDHAYWLAVLLNFGIVLIAVVWFSRKFVPGILRDRTAAIQRAMQEARKASADANSRLAEIEARLARLDGEINTMKSSAEQEFITEEARIKAAAAEDARRIIESAEQEIAAAAKQARRELTAYAADLSVSLAQRQIHVDAATDQVLVQSFVTELLASDRKDSGSDHIGKKGGR